MKQAATILLLIMTATNLAAQPEAKPSKRVGTTLLAASFTSVKDDKGDGPIFNGVITFEDLNKEPSFTWMGRGRAAYQPDESKITALKKLNDQYKTYTMVVFMGTWCDDSRNLIPKLEKVIDEVGFPTSRLTMYGVDREKTTTGGQERQYRITNVPTIILMDGEKEIGRITESVKNSIEADLAELLP
jgi:hypothetical protein